MLIPTEGVVVATMQNQLFVNIGALDTEAPEMIQISRHGDCYPRGMDIGPGTVVNVYQTENGNFIQCSDCDRCPLNPSGKSIMWSEEIATCPAPYQGEPSK